MTLQAMEVVAGFQYLDDDRYRYALAFYRNLATVQQHWRQGGRWMPIDKRMEVM